MNHSPAPKKSKPFRWLPFAGGAALLALLGFGLRPQPAPAETARAVYGPLRATVSEEGKTRIRQRYIVSSPVNGQLRRVPFKPGAELAANDIVAAIEPMAATPLDPRARRLAEARRDAAVATLEKTRAAHDLARSELGRLEKMFAEKTVSPQDLDNIRLRETAAARDVIAADGALRLVEAELAEAGVAGTPPALVEVHAPAGGRVLHVFQESERPVLAGTPLVEVGDPADLEVVIELLSRDGAALAPGAAVEFEQWGGPVSLAGKVRMVEPAAFTKISALGVEEQRVNVIADLTTPLDQRRSLGDNFRVEARVVLWQSDRVLKVPVSGLFRRGQDWAAYVLRDGRAALQIVKAGRASNTEMQVLAGLEEGDEVILYPGDRITEGQRVKPVKL
ncbi:MAG: efflux RND transporter periplasmic adaptor subunit [Opitutae bacterium]|nr:efflux RND transporter periplasmic adaptor subunit [Opitutae bacterium]